MSAAFTPSAWQYRKAITVQQSGYVRLNLDAEAFAGLQTDLRDLRVADSTGLETPYKVVVERQAGEVRRRQLAVYDNAYTPGQFQSLVVDLGESGGAHNWLSILTPEREFQKQVEISGSHDRMFWQVLKSDGYIFAHAEPRRNFFAKETSLTYPQATFRYLKLKVFSDTPFAINGVEVTERVSESAKDVAFTPTLLQVEDGATQSSLLTLDFGQGGLPIQEVTLRTAATNFNRPVELFASNDATAWRRVGSDYVFRVATEKFRGEHLTLRYPELAARYLRVAVFNGDDQPLQFSGATAKGILRSVVFSAIPGQQYFLYYGNPQAQRPAYDLERLFPYLEVPAAPGATLSPQQANPTYVAPAAPVIPFTERYPWLLPSVLVVVALGLLALMFRFVKRVKPPA
ncbi:MAG: DUF3999 family protein [bacterium]|nr:DUF3999 family protein [bacterium]